MSERPEGEKMLGITEAAQRLGVSINTLRAWVDRGYIKAVRLPSGHRRFTVDEVNRRRREMGLEG